MAYQNINQYNRNVDKDVLDNNDNTFVNLMVLYNYLYMNVIKEKFSSVSC